MDLEKVRLKEHLGNVASETSTVQFTFFVSPLRNKIGVGKDDYVLVDHPVYGEMYPLLAVVREIRGYEEVMGSALGEKSVNLVAVGEPVGYVDLRSEALSLHRLTIPPNPGSKVYLPYPEFLEDVLSRDTDGQRFKHALHLGTLDSSAVDKTGKVRQLNFFLNGDGLIKQHLLISGISGAGKTYLASVLVEELANKVGCPVVVMDPHGEYSCIGVPDSGFKALLQKRGVSAEDYSFGFKVSVHTCDADKVRSEFKKWSVDLEQPRRFSVEPVLDRWKGSSDEKDEADFSDVLRHGMKPSVVTVVDSRGISFEDRARLFECCANALLNGRLRGEVPPFVLLVDETSLLGHETLRMIASEGRRLGVSMCLLCQHPVKIGGEVLSQMGGQMIGRTTEAEDLECLKAMAGDKAGHLSELKRGEWIINGMMIRQPVKVHLRNRYSIHP